MSETPTYVVQLADGTSTTVDGHAQTPVPVVVTNDVAAYGLRTATGVVLGNTAAAPVRGQSPVAVDDTHFVWGEPPAATLSEYTSTLFDFTQADTVETVPLAGNDPVVANWTLTGLTAASGLPDADGNLRATALTESGTSARLASLAPTSHTLGAGWARVEFDYLPGAAYDARHLIFELNATQFVYLPSNESLLYPTGEPFYTEYSTTPQAGYTNGFEFTRLKNGWIHAKYETNITAAQVFAAQLCDISTRSASRFPLPGVAITIANVQITQDRVVRCTPARGSTDLDLVQYTDSARPVLSPDIWFGRPALIEGYGNSCALTQSISACSVASIGGVFWVRNLRPSSTARQIYSLNGASSKLSVSIDTTGVWSITRTNDAGVTVTTLTTHQVAPVPVCVQLVQAAGSVSLYIDGVLAAGGTVSTPTAATYTSRTLFGGDARSVCANLAETFGTVLTTAQVATQCTELRAMALLPAKWPWALGFGQSNATRGKGTPKNLAGSGVFTRPGYAYWLGDYGNSTTSWDTDPNITSMGVTFGWQAEALVNNAPSCVINCGHGGTPINSWLPGGADYTALPATVTAALAQFGTHLVECTDAIYTQGEAEANAAGTLTAAYAAQLTQLIAWIRGLYGSQVAFGITRVNEYLGPGTLLPIPSYVSGDAVRAAQDLVVATVSNTYTIRLDGAARTMWQVHYADAQCNEIGRIAWRNRHKQAARIAIIDPDYPQAGTWTTGGYWDLEHGVGHTGTTITSLTSREGGAVLAATGAPQLAQDATGGRLVAKFSTSDYLRLIAAARWNAFGGAAAVPYVMGVQWWVGSSGAGAVFDLCNADVSKRCIEIAISGTTQVAVRYGAGGSVQTTVANKTGLTAGSWQVAVYGSDGTYSYLYDSDGLVRIIELVGDTTGVDRLVVNARGAGTVTGDMSLRRLMVKPSTATAALPDIIKLYTALRALY